MTPAPRTARPAPSPPRAPADQARGDAAAQQGNRGRPTPSSRTGAVPPLRPRTRGEHEQTDRRSRRPPRRGAAAPAGAAPGGGGRPRGWFVIDEPSYRRRGFWLVLAFAAMTIAITARLLDVQVLRAPSLAAAAASEHIRAAPVHAERGRILDRNGRLLVSDQPLYAIYADPGMLQRDLAPEERRADAARLAPILGVATGAVATAFEGSGDFTYLAHQVSDEAKQKVAALGIEAIGAIPEDKRVDERSPVAGKSFAANLIGFVDHDGHGQYGLESYYDGILRGQDGSDSTVRDLQGNAIVLGDLGHVDARNGSDLRLGLDSSIQYYAEMWLAQQVASQQAESGQVLVMDTRTGSIRAWANYPTYDANSFAKADYASFRDLSIQGLYEPGSVMKVVTFAGALDAGVIQPQEQLVEPSQVINGYHIKDWDGLTSHGRITFQWVLDDSLNNGAVAVMQRLGHDRFYQNLQRFGIGSPTGVDLAGEVNQPMRPSPSWADIDFADAAFGQSVAVTPVEMLAAINTVANGGMWVQPHAVDAMVDSSTGQQTTVSPLQRRVMSPAAASTLKTMMTGVVEDRGASGFAVKLPAFKGQIAAKTGTADVAVNGRYGSAVIDSFVGFVPASNPQYTMLVVIRKPTRCTFMGHASACEGAYVAAPVWKQITGLIVDAWKILP